MAVLQSRDIQFIPELPTKKLNAIDKLGAGLMDKLIIEFDEVFWDRDADWINYCADYDNDGGSVWSCILNHY